MYLQNYSLINDTIGKSNRLRPSSSRFSIKTNPCTTAPSHVFINFAAVSSVPVYKENNYFTIDIAMGMRCIREVHNKRTNSS